MRHKLVATAVASLSVFAGQTVHADASASVTVNNIKFYVFDMDLNDGVTASASLETITGQSVSTWASVNGQFVTDTNTLPSLVNLSYLGASAQASLVGGGTLDSFILAAQVESSSGRSSSGSSMSLNFNLSKNAILVLSADGAASASTTVGATSAGAEWASASGSVTFSTWGDNINVGSQGRFDVSASGDAAGQFSSSGTFLAAFQNTSGNAIQLRGLVGSNAFVDIPVAAVPEAQTYAMLLTGLGVLGFVHRRRKQ